LDKKVFEADGSHEEAMIREGDMVPMEDEDGNPLNGIILEIKENTVLVDFNHPLAGMDLHFTGRIIDVREPTADELRHGHAHGPHAHHH
jgi:FKBP-type peptidyl-prolyl cis-trans isomerase SlyD